MEETEIINLPTDLGLIVAKELRDNHGINKWEDGSILTFSFSKEELSKIKSLQIKNPSKGCLEGIDQLPELRELYIESSKSGEFTPPNKIYSIADKDISCIEKCVNLETLSIVNQPNITNIDLSKLTNLEEVNISNNINLFTIYDIDKLPKLSFFTCYGNKSLAEIEGLDKAIIQNKENLSELNLDVLLFPKAIGYNTGNGNYNQEAVNALEYIDYPQGHFKIKWCDNISNFTSTYISHGRMLNMHNKACQILKDICHSTRIEDTILAVEKYLAENVKYDSDALEHGYQHGEDMGEFRLVDGRKYGTNSAYNCIMENSCICEGYTRGEQYLLGLRGIKTRNVACIAQEDTLGLSDHTKKDDWTTEYQLPKDGYHSIICIVDYYNLYSDPCWNATGDKKNRETLPYSLLTKEEISKDHTLSFEERKVKINPYAPSRNQVAKSIEDNKLFRNSRTSQVIEQKGKLQQDVIGIVRGSDGKTY